MDEAIKRALADANAILGIAQRQTNDSPPPTKDEMLQIEHYAAAIRAWLSDALEKSGKG